MARRRRDESELWPRSRRGVRNKALPQRVREARLASRTATWTPPVVRLIPVTRLYAWVGWMLLLPACYVTTRTLMGSLSESVPGAFWRTPAFWFFAMGFIMWLIWFLFLPRPVRLYVWGHEMTHALCVLMCGGQVKEFRVSAQGGHVVTNRNNFLISLSPYFVPLYTVMAVLAFLVAGLFCDLTLRFPLPGGGSVRPLYGLFYMIGLTWGFHLTFTMWMIARDQPDLRLHGTSFSLTLIYLANLLIISVLIILASPELSLAGFCHAWLDHAMGAVKSLWDALHLLAGSLGNKGG